MFLPEPQWKWDWTKRQEISFRLLRRARRADRCPALRRLKGNPDRTYYRKELQGKTVTTEMNNKWLWPQLCLKNPLVWICEPSCLIAPLFGCLVSLCYFVKLISDSRQPSAEWWLLWCIIHFKSSFITLTSTKTKVKSNYFKEEQKFFCKCFCCLPWTSVMISRFGTQIWTCRVLRENSEKWQKNKSWIIWSY